MELSTLTDEILLSRYCDSGRPELFEELVRRYWSSLFKWAFKFTGNASTAEDVRQIALINVHKNCRQFSGRSAVATWLFATVRNAAIGLHRKRNCGKGRKLWGMSIDCVPESKLCYLEQLEDGPSPVEMINRLPEKLRLVAELRFLEGEQYETIAQRACIPLGTVRSRLHRAVNEIRGQLCQ